MKQYEYMVIYSFNRGTGRMCVTTQKPITSYDDVEGLDETIRKHNNISTAFAIDFKLLREYEDNI